MTTNEDTPVNAPATKIPVDIDIIDRRTLYSARALNTVLKLLRNDLKVAEGGWTKKLTESMQRMNEPLRDDLDEERLGAKRAKEMLLEARKFRRERDDLEQEKKDDLAARKRVIAGFSSALDECLAIEADGNGDQLNLLEGQSGIRGMGWASAETVRSIYGAIKTLDERGYKLHAVLADLLVDLGTAGVEPVELNLSAGDAIENDTPVPAANDDDAPALSIAPAPVPF
jgi:hypothetical protein